MTDQDMLHKAYAAYNNQDSETLLGLVSNNVEWPNENALVHGKADLRSYWAHQWSEILTHDEVTGITEIAPETYVVHIKQVVRALDGSVVSRGEFEHVHQLEGGLIVRMQIRKIKAGNVESQNSRQ